MLIPVLVVLSLTLSQQGSTAAAADSVVQRELLQIENEIARANRECDYKYFAYIEAEEFIFTDASGGVTTRQQDLATEKDCRKQDYRSEVDEPRLLRYGDIVILNARNTVFLTDREGKPVVRRNRFTDVFVRRAGRWQLVSGHSSRIPDTANR